MSILIRLALPLACGVLLLTSTGLRAKPALRTEPVMLLADANMDACSGRADIIGNAPQAVHGGPSPSHPVIDRLPAGTSVWLCDGRHYPAWTGIIYSSDPTLDCNVSAPVDHDQTYRGPCESGWVPSNALELTAG
jgi:hypothetical protein